MYIYENNTAHMKDKKEKNARLTTRHENNNYNNKLTLIGKRILEQMMKFSMVSVPLTENCSWQIHQVKTKSSNLLGILDARRDRFGALRASGVCVLCEFALGGVSVCRVCGCW